MCTTHNSIPHSAYHKFTQSLIQREATRLHHKQAKAEKRGVVAGLALNEWLAILDSFKWRCAHCGDGFNSMELLKPFNEGGDLVMSNVYPICKACTQARFSRRQMERNLSDKLAAMYGVNNDKDCVCEK